jgi:CheY-like chemotaxis protein
MLCGVAPTPMKPLALVIENDGGTRRLLDVLLTRSGLEVDLVATGSDALILLAHARYDVVFVDLLLPGTSGMQVLEWIARERPALLAHAVVLSSAPEAHLQKVRDEWPEVRVVRKPFELGEIAESAQRILDGFEARTPSLAEKFCRTSVRAGAKAGVIAKRSGDPLELLLAFGYEPGEAESYFPLPLDTQWPICAAVREGSPVWLSSLTNAASSEYPQLAALSASHESRALAVVPLLRGARAVGAVAWTFREPRLFTDGEQQVFLSIAANLAMEG